MSGSDYTMATVFIVTTQVIGVALSTIAPTIRWFTAVKFKCSKKRGKSYKSEFKIEKYWIERLVEWKESTSVLQIRSQKCRKLIHYTKTLILAFLIRIQIVIVLVSKSIQLISTFFMRPYLSCCQYVTGFWKKLQSIALNNGLGSKSESKHGSKLDLSRYVLHLEGEEKLAQWIMTNGDTTNRLIQIGRKQRPKHAEELLQKSTGFKGVAEFDNDEVPSLNFQELPNCWSLPLTTLASIATALPNIKNHMVDQLIHSVGQGLFYARLVEDVLHTKGDFINIRNAAEKVWLDVELFRKWLNEDLRKMALEGKSSEETLGKLVDIAKNSVIEFKSNNENLKEDHVNWPAKVIAANSMYRMSQSILLNYQGSNEQTDEELFEKLCVTIADILGACLINLPRVISMKCFSSAIEKRDESVRDAACLLGETEEILKILQQHQLPTLDPNKVIYIDEWRTSMKQENPLTVTSSDNESTSAGSGELNIAIE